MSARVLVVEDDPQLAEVVAGYLSRAGFEVETAADGLKALAEVHTGRPDLVVLDLMLPGISGLEVLRRLRSEGSQVAVVVLSALGEDEDRVVGLERGADDYVVKPFSPRELVLRVQGLLRRVELGTGATLVPRTIVVGDLRVDVPARSVHRGQERLVLSHREFDLLLFLATHPDQAFTKKELLRRVWGWDFGDTSTVTVHVRRLRQKVEQVPSEPELVTTVWGVGYRFETPVPGVPAADASAAGEVTQ
ncbi:MAG: response regulator transcription factor [Actinobacteria bacterium]|nr:response regulator transcription factor [Actinomycetota bacterium]